MTSEPDSNTRGNVEGPASGASRALHAPWRMSYIEALATSDRDNDPGTPCFLRRYWLDPSGDERNFVIERVGGADDPAGGMILLNAYPYSNGHLLVALGESRPSLLDYTPAQRSALWSLTDRAVDLCERALGPQGINVGINQGEAAGAGVPEHLHVHVIPRWSGDTNFATAVAGVRVIPSALDQMASKYRAVVRDIMGR